MSETPIYDAVAAERADAEPSAPLAETSAESSGPAEDNSVTDEVDA